MRAFGLDEGFAKSVVDSLPAGVAVLAADGTIVFTNPAWDELFGYEPGSLVGRSIAVVNAAIDQDPAALAEAIIAETRSRSTWHGRIHNVRRSGQAFWTRADISSMRHPQLGDLLVSLQSELPERVAADLVSQELQPHLELFEELAQIGAWELDLDAQTVTCSRQMLRLHGVTVAHDPVPVAALLHLVHPDDRQTVIAAFDRVFREAELPELEYRVVHPDGTLRFMVIRGAPIDGASPPRRFGGVSVDVTDRHGRESALAMALEREQVAAADLRSADELKDLFLRALSHDLRTPLTVVQGFASVLAQRGDELEPAERRDYAQRIERSARRLHQQLTDLLDLDRLARGVLEPSRRPVELRKMAADVVEALDLMTRVEVVGESAVLSVDPAHIERVLENLVANAVRHTPEGSQVTVRCEPGDDGVLISVDDDGPGIPDELKGEVFNVFRKVHPMSSGAGVGLSLVRRFAELHGGRAWVDDRAGGGSSFRVFLPAAPPD